MATRSASRPRKTPSPAAAAESKPFNSPSSSTASSSRQIPEAFGDGQCSPASASARNKPHYGFPDSAALDVEEDKENVTVTVRFRPLSPREIRQGEEIAWYADGETMVRSENNPSLAYAYDRVFGPTTTTRHVYDIAAQHVVSGAMEGINGTIFAYGVTSSGKTHTMHGDQRSPGIIPLAVKDAFSIIQETPSREFLLRVSYLEIYNEVVNDLLNPAGQSLRVREDAQGTFVEGIKEEVVLSPAHALSLIAAGEEHRHVGSNNINLLSSRSHTMFTLTIESSPYGENNEGESVNFSQLNLIDLAGSEGSRAETTGMRRKEGSYINKSLLTLGTVIAKLTEEKASHVPYRDSKLTRLLQSSLSGQGRVSLICTVTPSSSNAEETHNTLKFAHRAKHIEIQALQNRIIDEKSLIKKYQHEIRSLKEELEQIKRGIVTATPLKETGENDLFLLKQKLEDGNVKFQSRLEQEEDAKAALLGRIQRLTKLILVSTKTTSPRFTPRPGLRRRHSFGEEELAYLPFRRRELILDDETNDYFGPMEAFCEASDDPSKDEKKTHKNGLLNWFKMRKRDSGLTALTSSDCDKSSGTKSLTAPSTPQAESVNFPSELRIFTSFSPEGVAADHGLELRYEKELQPDGISLQDIPLSMKTIDRLELIKEQLKILSGEVALHSSVLKRLTDEAEKSPKKENIQVAIKKITDEIKSKNQQMDSLEKQIASSMAVAQKRAGNLGHSPSYGEVIEQLNEKSLELEVKTADNRIIQEQLQRKMCECEELQKTVASLKQQLNEAHEIKDFSSTSAISQNLSGASSYGNGSKANYENSPSRGITKNLLHQTLLESEVKELKLQVSKLSEAKSQLETQNQKLADESTYAKGLASAAGAELKALSVEVTKLMRDNERLGAELASARSPPQRRISSVPPKTTKKNANIRRHEPIVKKEVNMNMVRELESALAEKEQREAELLKEIKVSKQREASVENELANMWVLVAKLKKSQGIKPDNLGVQTLSL